MHKLRFRQIHLDFHTSPDVPGIGADFDKSAWQETVRAGHVNSITCFAKCHHGWSYHPTTVGKTHPHLSFDLTRAQIDACKEMDVNVPLYLSAGVDDVAAAAHPEWRVITHEGNYGGWTQSPLEAGFRSMCFNTPYLDYLCVQIQEVVKLFPNNDGIFLDIIAPGTCCCDWCMASMKEKGFDPEKEADRVAHGELVLEEYYIKTTAAVRDIDSDMPVFHNSGHIKIGERDRLKYFSHLELESLPTGGWGYDHFPLSASYCLNLAYDVMGMTGKFHTTWADFGGYKHPNALRYECAAMLAFGSKCSVGDQLHPRGTLDPSTYDIIGAAYSEVEAKEPWCDNVTSMADIGLLSNAELTSSGMGNDNSADTGAGRMLLEGHLLFDLLDTHMDFDRYKMLILPDSIPVDAALKVRLDKFVADGGKLFLTGTSGLNPEGDGFVLDVGGEVSGPSEFEPDYAKPVVDLAPDFVKMPLVMHRRGQRLRVTDGESLGDVYDPYFNRDFRHFCSHQHTPNKVEPSGYSCGVRKGQIMYLSHPVFSIYHQFGAVAVKQYVVNCMRALLGDDAAVQTNLPSSGRVSLLEQAEEKRYVLHALYVEKCFRGSAGGKQLEVVEDLLPLIDTELSVKVPKQVATVTLEPQGVPIDFTQSGDRIELALDRFSCHQMIVLNYE